MKKHIMILGIASLAFLRCSHNEISHNDHSDGPHWSYVGKTGPSTWGELDPNYSTCKNGKQQSPIDISKSNIEKINPITFDYRATDFKIVDNGHTIQVDFAPGNTANIRGEQYDLVQMHFHTTSEHTLNGKAYPLELHLVHKNSKGNLAVVGVWMDLGKHNPDVDTVWSHIPSEKNKEVAATGFKLDPTMFIPVNRAYYHYTGSLTTPPCSEGVNWNLLQSPIKISGKQWDQFKKIYALNNRPVQPSFGRVPASSK